MVLTGKAALDAVKADLDHGIALQAQGKLEHALVHFQSMLPRATDEVVHSTVLTLIGLTQKMLGRREEALKSYDHAISLQASNVEAHFHRADVLDDLNRLTEAVEAYDFVLAIAPRHRGALTDKGYVLGKLGRHDDALKAYDAAIAADPMNAIAWNNKGNILFGDRRLEEARHCYEKALEADPRQPNARERLAELQQAAQGNQIDYAAIAMQQSANPMFQGFGALFDFSPASLMAVDCMLAELYGTEGDAPTSSQYQPSAGKQNLVVGLGCYVGETLRRVFDGTWHDAVNNPSNLGGARVQFAQGLRVHPVMRLLLRLKNGAREDAFPLYLELRAKLAPTGVAGEGESFFRQAERFASLGPTHAGRELAERFYAQAIASDPTLANRARIKITS